MNRLFLVASLFLLACVQVALADKDYKIGTLTKVPLHVTNKQQTSFTDTTDCTPGLAGTTCTGGIVNNYDGQLVATLPDGTEVVIGPCVEGATLATLFLPCSRPYILMLTQEDGTTVFLDHIGRQSGDVGQKLETVSKVLYREYKRGLPSVTYFAIPDPNNPKKEANYYIHKLPKQKAEVPKDVQTSPDNVTAMCASGKLSREQQAKYCQPKQN